MCNPAILAVMTIAASAAQGISQNKQAKATANAIEHQDEVASDEIADQSSLEQNEQVREAHRQQARIRVASGESGLQGQSLDLALGNALFQQNFDSAITAKNESNRQRARKATTDTNLSRLQIQSAAMIGFQSAAAGTSTYANAGGRFGKP
jgi:hypothetical protein